NDLNGLFDGFMIDLTNIGAGDKTSPDKAELVKYFKQLLTNKKINQEEVKTKINTLVPQSTLSQYHTGL
ncbi:MAG: hypothetical protein RPR97_15230, partial [Colwellia sp.]